MIVYTEIYIEDVKTVGGIHTMIMSVDLFFTYVINVIQHIGKNNLITIMLKTNKK